MFSINTNNSAMAALESLRMTNSALTQTENEVSTGLAVSSASDNPAIYAISQQMDGNIAGLSAVSSGLSFGASVVSTAQSATGSIISTLQNLQNTITQAGTSGITLSAEQSQVADALNQINDYARNSTFQGVNLLTSQSDAGSSVSNTTMSIVDGLQGSTLSVANQAAAANPGAVTLTDALGLTSNMSANGTVLASGTPGTGQVTQSILTGSSTGVNMSVTSGLVAGSFANGTTVAIANGDGSTTTFEFDAAGQPPVTADTATNHTVVVTVNTATESTNQMIGDLVNSMNENGYSAAVQNDGSINVVGQGLTGVTSGATGLNNGTPLSAGASAITTIQAAITAMTGIADSLAYTTQQITGIQTFTGDLSDALTSGVGALTDADLSAESAKLTSLQTKQQLAIQSLSIANSQSQSILSLFR